MDGRLKLAAPALGFISSGSARASGRREGVELFTVALNDCVSSGELIFRRVRRAIAGARLLRLPEADPGRRLAVSAACRLRKADARLQHQDPRVDHDAQRLGDEDRHFQVLRWDPHEGNGRSDLQPPRLHSRGRVLPQRDAGRLAGGDPPEPGGQRRDALLPGPDLRSVDGQQSAVSHRQHGHGLRQRSFST